MKKLIFIVIALLAFQLNAQVPDVFPDGIIIGNYATDPTGFRAGQLYYNTTDSEIKFYNGSTWETIGGATPTIQQVLTAGNDISEGTNFNFNTSNVSKTGSIFANTFGLSISFDTSDYNNLIQLTEDALIYDSIDLSTGEDIGFNFTRDSFLFISVVPTSAGIVGSEDFSANYANIDNAFIQNGYFKRERNKIQNEAPNNTEIDNYTWESINGNAIFKGNGGTNGSTTPAIAVSDTDLSVSFENQSIAEVYSDKKKAVTYEALQDYVASNIPSNVILPIIVTDSTYTFVEENLLASRVHIFNVDADTIVATIPPITLPSGELIVNTIKTINNNNFKIVPSETLNQIEFSPRVKDEAFSIASVSDDVWMKWDNVNSQSYSAPVIPITNIIINGIFDDATNLTLGSDWTISGGTANYADTQDSNTLTLNTSSPVIAGNYTLTFDITSGANARFAININGVEVVGSANYGVGARTVSFTYAGADFSGISLRARNSSGGTAFSIDNVELIQN